MISMMPANQSSVNMAGAPPAGVGAGKPKNLDRPCCSSSKAATIRKMLRTRGAHAAAVSFSVMMLTPGCDVRSPAQLASFHNPAAGLSTDAGPQRITTICGDGRGIIRTVGYRHSTFLTS
jgi:hypothetical protein